MREEKKITQKDLARMANVSQPYLFDLENNRRGGKPETIKRIADALGVDVEELFEQKAG